MASVPLVMLTAPALNTVGPDRVTEYLCVVSTSVAATTPPVSIVTVASAVTAFPNLMWSVLPGAPAGDQELPLLQSAEPVAAHDLIVGGGTTNDAKSAGVSADFQIASSSSRPPSSVCVELR